MTEATHPTLDKANTNGPSELPLNKEGTRIQSMFDGIAPRYDLLNHLLSMNMDKRWRKLAIDELRPEADGCFLDACAGTGDLAHALAERLDPRHSGAKIYASDFSLGMMQRGKDKSELGFQFVAGDTLKLPFEDNTFDGAMVGFGIRNVQDLAGGLAELRRVLKGGGRLILLEFTPIRNRVLRPMVDFYCRSVMPRIGNIISGSRDQAYSYLNASMERWPDGETLAGHMRSAGFKGVRWRPLFPGLVALHRGYR